MKGVNVATFVDSKVQEIDDRLRELADDMSKLKAARAVLAANEGSQRRAVRRAQHKATATATARTRRATSPRSPARHGGRTATRAAQTVEIVRSKPGITIPELAKAMNIGPNYLYRVLPKLVADGQVKRDGRGWRVPS